jgi:hypothetical protein
MTILWMVLAVVALVAGCAAFYRRGRHGPWVPVHGGQIGRSRRAAHMENQARKWWTNG